MSILLSCMDCKAICRDMPHSCKKAATIHAVQYLGEPCTEHPITNYLMGIPPVPIYFGDNNTEYFLHRKDCPDCMKQVHEELNIQ